MDILPDGTILIMRTKDGLRSARSNDIDLIEAVGMIEATRANYHAEILRKTSTYFEGGDKNAPPAKTGNPTHSVNSSDRMDEEAPKEQTQE